MSSGLAGVRGRVTEFAGVPMISYGPMPHDEINAFLKRAVDVSVATVGLVIAMPLMAAIAVAIRILDPGPALFRRCVRRARAALSDVEVSLDANRRRRSSAL
jgi:lipopolysaccharide/colanic/teichoic acid biosynthesis glycosyltransferase